MTVMVVVNIAYYFVFYWMYIKQWISTTCITLILRALRLLLPYVIFNSIFYMNYSENKVS